MLLRRSQTSSMSAAEGCFFGAIALTREQDALLWELRAAFSLARMRANQGRQDEGKRILASVYDRFTEGFGTADLLSARDLLAQLNEPLQNSLHEWFAPGGFCACRSMKSERVATAHDSRSSPPLPARELSSRARAPTLVRCNKDLQLLISSAARSATLSRFTIV